MSEDTDAVLAANEAFYRAFSERDLDAMASLWSETEPVYCIHPGWDVLEGHAEIMTSWRDILGNPGSPKVRITAARAAVDGDLGIVICHEILPDGVLIATNLFVRDGGSWRLMHHHAGPTGLDAPSAAAAPSDTVH